MAVELRCPECRAKLRLSKAPEPDSEVECSKCGFVFSTDDNLIHAGESDEDDKPAKKKPVANDGDNEKPKKKSEANTEKKPSSEPKKNDKTKAADKPFKRKKRRSKKKKTNPVVLWSVLGGAVMILGFAAGILIWMMGKKTSSQEMMSYLPDDCDEVSGLNIDHLQKYPDFNKTCEPLYAAKGFKKAADVFSKALGSETKNVLEYVIQGTGKTGGREDGSPVEATVLRTKMEFDTNLVNKIPGAKEYSAAGVKYYTIDDIPELGYPDLRVFAPTNRLVVFCRGDMPDNKFKAMLTGNTDNADGVVYKRAGPLIKQVTRGTAWKFTLYGRSVPKPAATTPGASTTNAAGKTSGPIETDEDSLKKEIAEILSAAQGAGYKASVGSRDVRGEWIVWYKDSDAAYNQAKKWKDKDWVKDDEKTPPRWWKYMADKSGGGKTAANALKDGLGFRSSGETFSVRASLEANVLKGGISQLVQVFTGQRATPGGMPSMPNGAGNPQKPGGQGMPTPPPGGMPQPAKNRRRFPIRYSRGSFSSGSR